MLNAAIVFLVVTGSAFLLGYWQRDHRFTSLMVIYGIVISIATIFALNASVIGAPWDTPYLAGSDGEGYFDQARLLANEGLLDFQSLIRANYLGYQLFLALLFTIFSPTLLVGLVANAVVLLISVVCLYRATFLLTNSSRAAVFASAAMMLTTSHIYYGLMLLKEPAVGLAMALVLLALTKTLQEKRVGFKPILYMLIALAVIVSMRATLILFLVIIFAYVGTLLLKRRAYLLVLFIGLMILSAPLARQFSNYEFDANFLFETITQNDVISARFQQGDLDLTGIAGRVGTFYVNVPFIFKVLLFPIPTILQLFIPFDFWGTQFIHDHPAFFFSRNLNLLWILVVVPWVLLAAANVRRIAVPIIPRFLLAGVTCYIVVAVIYGGLIPRYGAPTLFFIYPAVGYWWARTRDDAVERAKAVRFFAQYYAIFVIGGLGYLGLQTVR